MIDYFSLDVELEGAEWRVMQRFPFDRYRFLTITIERAAPWLHAHLIANGYVRRKNVHFGSFYVHSSVAAALDAPESKYEETAAKCTVNGKGGIPGRYLVRVDERGGRAVRVRGQLAKHFIHATRECGAITPAARSKRL